jgi:hypothetical protein
MHSVPPILMQEIEKGRWGGRGGVEGRIIKLDILNPF